MTANRILVVDDEDAIRELLQDTLEDEGFEVTTAINGKDAYDKFNRETFDVVFTDLKMPHMTGSQLFKKIKEDSPATIVIVMTGHADIATALEALHSGVDDFLLKPVPSISMISHAIQRCISRRDALAKAVSMGRVSRARDQVMAIAWEELEKNFAELNDCIKQMKLLHAAGEHAKAAEHLDDLAESFADAQRVLQQLESARSKLAGMDDKNEKPANSA